jgi:translation initiation factor 1A
MIKNSKKICNVLYCIVFIVYLYHISYIKLKMVKNTGGGNKSKGQARKYLSNNSANKALKTAEDDYELYAQVTKMLGNGMCYVLCMDGKTRLCYIRGKFKGRGKRDNFIGLLSWILVGLRDFETVKEGSQENCDLLEVYTDAEKEKLRTTVHENWSLFTSSSTEKQQNNSSNSSAALDIEFIDEKTEEYMKLMEEELSNINTNNTNTNTNTNTNNNTMKSNPNKIVFETGEEIDIDDI